MKRLTIFAAFAIVILALLVAYDFSHYVHVVSGGQTYAVYDSGYLPTMWDHYCAHH